MSRDQRGKGYTAWIEDENGVAVDEQLLKMNGRVAMKRTLPERMGPLVVVASVIFGLVVLYLLGLWAQFSSLLFSTDHGGGKRRAGIYSVVLTPNRSETAPGKI